MLKFRLAQIRVDSLERYFLPLPKLGSPQIVLLREHLEGKGFHVKRSPGSSRWVASKGGLRMAIDGGLGVAASSEDMLDFIAPAIPAILESRKTTDGADVSSRYISVKSSKNSSNLHVSPRLESLAIWTALRGEGLCGLTPDEAEALRRVLNGARGEVECVTDSPREGAKHIQVSRRVYYRSVVPVAEFLASLKTVDSGGEGPWTYLPRDSILRVKGLGPTPQVSPAELGEWYCV